MTDGTGSSARPRLLRAARAVIANGSMRDAQIALALARAVDLAQLVVVSTFLFSRGGAASVATYGIVRTLAPTVGVPVATAVGCRLGHGGLLCLMGSLAGVGSFAMAGVAASGGSTMILLLGAGVVGVALGCFRPVISALLPELVRSPAELLASNAAIGLLDGASTLVGPAVGCLVALTLGVAPLLVLTGCAVIAAGLVAGRLSTTPSIVRSSWADREERGRLAEYVAGARELAANRATRLVALLGTAQTTVRGALGVIVVVFAGDVLPDRGSGVGALYAAMGVGGLVGIPLAILVVDRLGLHRSLAMGVSTWGAPLAICALVARPADALVLFGVIGVANSVVDISYYGIVQRAVADGLLSRVLGVLEATFQTGLAVGAFVGAVLVDRLGPKPALVVVGLALPALAMLTTPRLGPLDRALTARDNEIATLRRSACLAPLPMSALDHLAGRATRVRFAAGDVIMAAGDGGDSYVLIEEGIVEIAHDGLVSTLLRAGRELGEGAGFQQVSGAATVSARSAGSARIFDRSSLLTADASAPSSLLVRLDVELEVDTRVE